MASGGQNNNNNRVLPSTPPFSYDITSFENNPNSSLTDSIHNPFFLHNGDHLGLALVSHILFGPNYNTWTRAMSFNAKNKLDFVDGTLPQPHIEDPTTNIWSTS